MSDDATRTQLMQAITAHVVTCHHCSTVGVNDDYCAEFFQMTTRLNTLVRHEPDAEHEQRLAILAEIANISQAAGEY